MFLSEEPFPLPRTRFFVSARAWVRIPLDANFLFDGREVEFRVKERRGPSLPSPSAASSSLFSSSFCFSSPPLIPPSPCPLAKGARVDGDFTAIARREVTGHRRFFSRLWVELFAGGAVGQRLGLFIFLSFNPLLPCRNSQERFFFALPRTRKKNSKNVRSQMRSREKRATSALSLSENDIQNPGSSFFLLLLFASTMTLSRFLLFSNRSPAPPQFPMEEPAADGGGSPPKPKMHPDTAASRLPAALQSATGDEEDAGAVGFDVRDDDGSKASPPRPPRVAPFDLDFDNEAAASANPDRDDLLLDWRRYSNEGQGFGDYGVGSKVLGLLLSGLAFLGRKAGLRDDYESATFVAASLPPPPPAWWLRQSRSRKRAILACGATFLAAGTLVLVAVAGAVALRSSASPDGFLSEEAGVFGGGGGGSWPAAGAPECAWRSWRLPREVAPGRYRLSLSLWDLESDAPWVFGDVAIDVALVSSPPPSSFFFFFFFRFGGDDGSCDDEAPALHRAPRGRAREAGLGDDHGGEPLEGEEKEGENEWRRRPRTGGNRPLFFSAAFRRLDAPDNDLALRLLIGTFPYCVFLFACISRRGGRERERESSEMKDSFHTHREKSSLFSLSLSLSLS